MLADKQLERFTFWITVTDPEEYTFILAGLRTLENHTGLAALAGAECFHRDGSHHFIRGWTLSLEVGGEHLLNFRHGVAGFDG